MYKKCSMRKLDYMVIQIDREINQNVIQNENLEKLVLGKVIYTNLYC